MNGPTLLYLIHATGTNMYKVGVTNDIAKRKSQLQTASPHRLEVLHTEVHPNRFAALEAEHQTREGLVKSGLFARASGEWVDGSLLWPALREAGL